MSTTAEQETRAAIFAELRAARTACHQACSAYQHVSRGEAYIGRVAELARLGTAWDHAIARYITARAAAYRADDRQRQTDEMVDWAALTDEELIGVTSGIPYLGRTLS